MNRAFYHRFFLIALLNSSALMAQTDINMQNGRFRICKGNILDSDAGKNTGYYDHNENYILTLSLPGATSITLDFISFCTEIDADVLSIFDGKDTNSGLIGRYSGSISPGKVSSTDSFITLHFKSDQSVSCTGWKARVINNIQKPVAAKFSLNKAVNCYDSVVRIKLDKPVFCDSLNINNTFINNNKISYIKPINCINDLSKEFDLYYSGIASNGSYRITHKHGYRDYCDSVYILSSSLTFTVKNCPIVLEIFPSSDTICLGDCIKFTTKATGGDSKNYTYTWEPNQIKGANPSFCPKKSQKITLKVEDGNAIPGYDTVNIVVLDPPNIQNDTSVCYYNNPFLLQATPSGGKWYGKGIVNQNTGLFNPRLAWGVNKIWYQIGSCADTMNMTVSRPYNYENVFCPGNIAYPVYWYGPPGGTWTGPKITPAGVFLPDTPGIYKVTYTWQGCTSDKEIRVESVLVPEVDTTCESRLRDTLDFDPKGLIIRGFKGLINGYWGWYNPSIMGGPGDYNVIFQGRGSCRDTTKITVLPCFAGDDQTICPSEGSFYLSGYRKTSDAIWAGKGIIDSKTGLYDPSWSQGKEGFDTVYLISRHCIDSKVIALTNTDIFEDTVSICPNSPNLELGTLKVNVPGGIWSGPEVYSNDSFDSKTLKPGFYSLQYTQNNCSDSFILKIYDYVNLPSDTLVCRNTEDFQLRTYEEGFYWGNGVYLNIDSGYYMVNINKSILDSVNVYFTNDNKCDSIFHIRIINPANISFDNVEKTLCFKDTNFVPNIDPAGGKFWINGLWQDFINPELIGSGSHNIPYLLDDGICRSIDSWTLVVKDSIVSKINPASDSICWGGTSTLLAQASGGLGNYKYYWSNNQSGSKTSFSPKKTNTLDLIVSDGCSNDSKAEIEVFVYPKVWFSAVVSDSVCYGADGFIDVKLRNGDNADFVWSYPGEIINGRYYAPSGNDYRVFVTDNLSGCFGDTSIHIPGFRAVEASIQITPPLDGICYSPLDSVIQVRNTSAGVENGSLTFNSSFLSNLETGSSYYINSQSLLERNKIKFFIVNGAGCSDSIEIDICYKDTVFVLMPNAFSPDGNGINDTWNWSLSGANEAKIMIYNRWGQCLFQSTEPQGKWDGNYLGKPLPEGIYIVAAVYKGERTAKRKFGQTILLMRNKQ